MFDYFRNNMKYFMGLLMLLIIPGFVLLGVEGYSGFRDSAEPVAKVGRLKITDQEWEAAHRNEVERRSQSMPNIDKALFETRAARMDTLERMVDERVLALAAQKQNFVTTDQRLARELASDPDIAAVRRADGTLDMAAYDQLAARRGTNAKGFEQMVRSNMAVQQVTKGVVASSFVADSAAQRALGSFFERREVQVARFAPGDYAAKVQVTEAEVEAYYQANGSRFQSPETVDIEYLVMDLAGVEKTLKLNEADVRAYYEQNQAKLAGDETRRASHILLTVANGASAADKAAVRAKADGLLKQLQANPAQFAELAKRESQDPGSAAQGGDLGFFGRNDMVKPFADAVFGLTKGALSGVVETEFGFHIISLTDIKAPVAKPFEAMRPQLEAELRRQQAQKTFAELSVNFSDMVYEQSDNLTAAAEKFGLTVQTQKGLSRSGPLDAKAPAVLSSPKLLAALFAEDAIRQKRNISAVETASGQLVSARVLAHQPVAARPLKDVAQQVRDVLIRQKALAMAKTEGQTRLASWKGGAAPSGALAAALVISRIQPQGLPPSLLAAAMTAQLQNDQPAWAEVDLGEQGYAVVRVNKVLPRQAPTDAQAQQERQQLNQLWAQAEGALFMKALRQRHEAVVLAKDGQAPGAAR